MTDIDALLTALTLEEKASLTAGEDMWSTVAVDRLGIPKVLMTDGPSGARGVTVPGGGTSSTCIPCGSAIGASWDPGLAEALGAVVGKEALDRGCRILLAPTVNLHRNVLAGRNFECYSEDPLLSGKLAAGFVRGVQSAGVIATVKHFVANESEFERNTMSSVVDERTLRELYLLPFELVVREGRALGMMTAYNRLNGKWLTQRPEVLLDILRGEWGFEGLVMTDWFAAAETKVSTKAGLDLEMPGPGRALGATLLDAVKNGEVALADLDAAVRRLLSALDRTGALEQPTPPVAPQPPTDDDVALVRRAAAASMVLLRNEGVLPLDGDVSRVAVIGVNAAIPRIMGGGSSEVTPHRLISPLEAIRSAFRGAEVTFDRGAEVDLAPVPVGRPGLFAEGGFDVEVHRGLDLSGEVLGRQSITDLRFIVMEPPLRALEAGNWSLRASGTVVAEESGTHTLALSQIGRTRVLLDGSPVLDGFTGPAPGAGTEFFGLGSLDVTVEVDLHVGVPVEVVVEYAAADGVLDGFRVGFRPPERRDLLDRAAAAAAAAEVAVVVVGTTSEWESESRDRTSFRLPGEQDELVRRVTAANPRTVVIVNAGAPVDLPWADDVGAVLQCWFGGQELGPALADVLAGTAEPGGRLPTTIPLRLEHSPSWGNYPGENGEVRYGEGLFMGYRGYEHRGQRVRYPFGHGLGYTTFEIGAPTLSSSTFTPGGTVTVSVPVTNTGTRHGTEVVQVYVAPAAARLARPAKELKAFRKVELDPGESTVAELVLDNRSFACWDPGQPDWEHVRTYLPSLGGLMSEQAEEDRTAKGWHVDPGRYDIFVGRSSTDLPGRAILEVPA